MFKKCCNIIIFLGLVTAGWLTGVISSAAYKKWEKAAIAGVSLVADAAEHLERSATDKEVDHEPGIAGGCVPSCSFQFPCSWKHLNSRYLKVLTPWCVSILISRPKGFWSHWKSSVSSGYFFAQSFCWDQYAHFYETQAPVISNWWYYSESLGNGEHQKKLSLIWYEALAVE